MSSEMEFDDESPVLGREEQRMALWRQVFVAMARQTHISFDTSKNWANHAVTEFDKTFPERK